MLREQTTACQIVSLFHKHIHIHKQHLTLKFGERKQKAVILTRPPASRCSLFSVYVPDSSSLCQHIVVSFRDTDGCLTSFDFVNIQYSVFLLRILVNAKFWKSNPFCKIWDRNRLAGKYSFSGNSFDEQHRKENSRGQRQKCGVQT